MKSVKYLAAIAVLLGATAVVSHGAFAYAKHKSTKVITQNATPGDVKTSNDDQGMKPEAAPNDKVGTIPGESTPGDVKTSDDDSGMNPEAAPNDKVGTIPGKSTPGDVKTSNADSGMNPDDAAHDKVIENGHVVKK